MTAARARNQMVEALRASGRLRSPAVEAAFRDVPRHLFLPDLPIAEAYADEAVAVQHVDGVATSSASQPSMMAIMLEQLDARPGDRVLEIGAGTGYNAALLARIVGPTGTVTSVDIDAELIDSARAHLATAGASGIELVCADGALGYDPAAPYDRIVLTVGSSDVRPEWVAQLAPGGRLLLPLAVRGSQLSVALDLGADGLLRSDSVRGCAFIRLRGIGASHETHVELGPDLSLQVPEDAEALPDRATLAMLLGSPGPVRPSPAPLGLQDLWDGFGLWLALTDTRAVRLFASDAGKTPPRARDHGQHRRPEHGQAQHGRDEHGHGQHDHAGAEQDESDHGLPKHSAETAELAHHLAATMYPIGVGSAAVALVGPGPGLALAGPAGPVDGEPGAACVRSFGPGGQIPADRMIAALAAWEAAGYPQAAGLQLVVAPRPLPLDLAPGAQIAMPNALVAGSWPGATAR